MILKQAEQWPLRVATQQTPKPDAHLPIEVLKHYSTFNPYEPEEGEHPDQAAQVMKPYEDTLSTHGWEGFGKSRWPAEGIDTNYPILSVGKSGKHAVLNGHHRLWAADKMGMSHVPVDFETGEDDDWAKKYGQPVEPHVSGLLKGINNG
jgi:hypothetical protein